MKVTNQKGAAQKSRVVPHLIPEVSFCGILTVFPFSRAGENRKVEACLRLPLNGHLQISSVVVLAHTYPKQGQGGAEESVSGWWE